jgi:hypothetical protein
MTTLAAYTLLGALLKPGSLMKPKDKWQTNLVGNLPERPEAKHIYQEWYIGHIHFKHSPNQYYIIVQPKKDQELYEIWYWVGSGIGNRYTNNAYKCVNSFPSLKAAKTAVLLMYSAEGIIIK